MRRFAALTMAIVTAMAGVPPVLAQEDPSTTPPIAVAAGAADTVGVVRGNTVLLRASNRGGGADATVTYGRPGDLVVTGDWDGDGDDTIGVRRGNVFYLRNSLSSGRAQITFSFGRATDTPVVGDWDGDGIDTIGVRRGNVFYLRNSLSSGRAQVIFSFGRATDTPVVGDWDGDGDDTIGVRRGNVFYLRNSPSSGRAQVTLGYGRATDTPVVGDWDGDGDDTIGVRRGNVFYLRNSLRSGRAQITFSFGRATDTPVVGDWDGDGDDTIGVRRGNVFYLRNSLRSGRADRTLGYGRATDTPVVGDWDGDGDDTIGVRRGSRWYLRNSLSSGRADRIFAYGRAADRPITGAWGIGARNPAPGPPELRVRTVVSGLTIPWGIGFAPDGTMLFTERHGVLSARRPDGTVRTVAADLGDLFASGETGLMGLVVDPDFASNRRFYTCQGHTGPQIQVIAWTMNATYSRATRVADPLVGGIPATTGRHGGCRLRFGPDGYLWIATGDAARGSTPQNLTSLGGKVLRVDPATGAGAASNPFAGSANANTRRIYTFGHRNLQGLARRPGTSQMWSVEHGPSVDDEINRLRAGGNYGWDPVPGYNEAVPMTDRVTFPDAVRARWSSGAPTLATSGAVFLEGEQWGRWEGRLAVATLKDSALRVFAFTPQGRFVNQLVVPELDGTFGRLRTPMLGPDGALYVSTANGGGTDRIVRIVAR